MRDPLLLGSPDGHVQMTLAPVPERLTCTVSFHGASVIEPSPIALAVDEIDICAGVEFGEVETFELNERYPWRGNRAEAVNHCRGARIGVRHVGSAATYTMEMRAFDDGAAFRLIVPGTVGQSRVPEETTAFTLPAGSILWHHDLHGHYEGAFARRSGRNWFLAIVNGPKARGMEVPLSFLGPGRYQAMLVRDDPEDSSAVVVERDTTHEAGDTLAIRLSAGGGFIGRFTLA